MNVGKAWLIFEEHFHTRERHLLSVISPRKMGSYICDLMEQMYVDRFASIHEKITYKKDRKKSAFKMEHYERRGPSILSCGHEPIFRAYYCHKVSLAGDKLLFSYRVIREEGGREIYAEFEDSIDVT